MTVEELAVGGTITDAELRVELRDRIDQINREGLRYGLAGVIALAVIVRAAAKWGVEHPLDDGEPLTAEWLTTAGGQVCEDGDWWFYGGGGDVVLSYHDNRECGDVYRLATCGGLPRVEVSSRGQLRRLCDSLGMKLKESK